MSLYALTCSHYFEYQPAFSQSKTAVTRNCSFTKILRVAKSPWVKTIWWMCSKLLSHSIVRLLGPSRWYARRGTRWSGAWIQMSRPLSESNYLWKPFHYLPPQCNLLLSTNEVAKRRNEALGRRTSRRRQSYRAKLCPVACQACSPFRSIEPCHLRSMGIAVCSAMNLMLLASWLLRVRPDFLTRSLGAATIWRGAQRVDHWIGNIYVLLVRCTSPGFRSENYLYSYPTLYDWRIAEIDWRAWDLAWLIWPI